MQNRRSEQTTFIRLNHQIIFEALLDLNADNKVADEILLAEQLESRKQLDQVGGQNAYSVTSRIDTTAHATYWLEIVKEKALLRRCIYVAFEIIDGANNLQGEVDDFLSGMEQRVCECGRIKNPAHQSTFVNQYRKLWEKSKRCFLKKNQMDYLPDIKIWIILLMD